jgi:hypothetical protein
VLHQQSGQHVQTLRGHLRKIQIYSDISATVNETFAMILLQFRRIHWTEDFSSNILNWQMTAESRDWQDMSLVPNFLTEKSGFFPSRIPDPHQSIYIGNLTQKIGFQAPGNMIRVANPGSGSSFFTHPRSRIQGSKRQRIPDPDPQHWLICSGR